LWWIVVQIDYNPGMNPSIRTAMERRDATRGEWWLARMDTDPPGQWTLTADPAGPWDWRFKVGSCKSRAVQRLRAAADREAHNRRRLLATPEHAKKCVTGQGNLLAIPGLTDTISAKRGLHQFAVDADNVAPV
jgi:hypothetical protein